jgi:hypothetical protein
MFSFTSSILSFQTAQEVLEHIYRELLGQHLRYPKPNGVVADRPRFVTRRPVDRSEGTVVQCGVAAVLDEERSPSKGVPREAEPAGRTVVLGSRRRRSEWSAAEARAWFLSHRLSGTIERFFHRLLISVEMRFAAKGASGDDAAAPTAASLSPRSFLISEAGVRREGSQHWVISVARLSAAIEGVAVDGHDRRVEQKTDGEVRVGDKRLAEGDKIGLAVRDRCVGPQFVESIIGDDKPAEEPLQSPVIEGRDRIPGRIALDHMQVGEAPFRQLRRHAVEERLRVRVGDVVLHILGGYADANARTANARRDRIDHLDEKADAVLDAPAIPVGAPVRAIPQELVDQVAVRGMHLDAVEAGGESVTRRLSVLLDDAGYLFCPQCARRRDRLEASFGKCLRLGPDGGGCKRQAATWLERRVRDAPYMPELEHHVSSGHVDRLRHQAPTADLLGAVHPWRRNVALALLRDLRGFGNDQPRAGALRIVKGIEGGWDVALGSAAASQGAITTRFLRCRGPTSTGVKRSGPTCAFDCAIANYLSVIT